MEGWVNFLVWTVIGALLSAFLGLVMFKGYQALTKRVHIETDEARGPTTREHGFTESSVRVTIKNDSGEQLSVTDIRLMFCRRYGFPVLTDAPLLRSHPSLPAVLNSGTSMTWHFPAEKMAGVLTNLSLVPSGQSVSTNLRPRITTAGGKVYKGKSIEFSIDVNSHWL